MTAYLMIDIQSDDWKAMKPYVQQVGPVIEAFGGRFLVRGGDPQVLEGDAVPNTVVVVAFPDRETVLRFHASPEYAPLKEYRTGKSTLSSFVVEGVEA